MEKKEVQVKLEKKDFIRKKEKIWDKYYFDSGKPLWIGQTGEIRKVLHIATKIERAVRIVSKFRIQDIERFVNEITRLKEFDHPNIIRLHEWYDDAKYFYVIVDLCIGGEVLDRVSQMGSCSEEKASRVFEQMLRSVAYCNANGLILEDVTPRSFMFLNNSPDSPILLVDLGLSHCIDKKKLKGRITPYYGDPYYTSPEQATGTLSPVSNMWSLGAILYLMMSGSPPFTGSSDARVLAAVKEMKFSFELSLWGAVSDTAKNLISKLLTKKEVRLRPDQVLAHPWLKLASKSAKALPSISLGVISNLKKFRSAQKLKQAVMTYIATQLSEKELKPLREMFLSLDKNGDGKLSHSEIMTGLRGRPDEHELTELMLSIDTDNNGYIEYNEFLAAAIGEECACFKERLHDAFALFDRDKSGSISAKELKNIIHQELSEADVSYWTKLISQVDKNGDGEIDFLEFQEIMNSL